MLIWARRPSRYSVGKTVSHSWAREVKCSSPQHQISIKQHSQTDVSLKKGEGWHEFHHRGALQLICRGSSLLHLFLPEGHGEPHGHHHVGGAAVLRGENRLEVTPHLQGDTRGRRHGEETQSSPVRRSGKHTRDASECKVSSHYKHPGIPPEALSKQTETQAERQTRPANKQAPFTGRDPEQINPEARRQNLIKLLFESSGVCFTINPHDSNLALLKARHFI